MNIIFISFAYSAKLTNVNVEYTTTATVVKFIFNTTLPENSYFFLKHPDRFVVDFKDSALDKNTKILPRNINHGAVKIARISAPITENDLRLVIELSRKTKTKLIKKNNFFSITINNDLNDNKNNTLDNKKNTSDDKNSTVNNKNDAKDDKNNTVDNKNNAKDDKQNSKDDKKDTSNDKNSTVDNKNDAKDDKNNTVDNKNNAKDDKQNSKDDKTDAKDDKNNTVDNKNNAKDDKNNTIDNKNNAKDDKNNTVDHKTDTKDDKNNSKDDKKDTSDHKNSNNATDKFLMPKLSIAPIVVAIDAGHGGKDPGTIGINRKIREKDITLSIARELYHLLKKDRNFTPVLTRANDTFIAVPDRSEIARKHKANFIISIHADSAPDASAKGTSVWILSNSRANDELGHWLEETEAKSDLLGGGNVGTNKNDKYLSSAILDLKFVHSQAVAYELGKEVLSSISKINALHKSNPLNASLGVLKSPDIPSILVETAFLSNPIEEIKLANKSFHQQIAKSIYNALVTYETKHYDLFKNTKFISSKDNKDNSFQTSDEIYILHRVQKNETLSVLADKYNIKMSDVIALNNLKKTALFTNQKLRLKIKNSTYQNILKDDSNKKATTKKATNKTINKKINLQIYYGN